MATTQDSSETSEDVSESNEQNDLGTPFVIEMSGPCTVVKTDGPFEMESEEQLSLTRKIVDPDFLTELLIEYDEYSYASGGRGSQKSTRMEVMFEMIADRVEQKFGGMDVKIEPDYEELSIELDSSVIGYDELFKQMNSSTRRDLAENIDKYGILGTGATRFGDDLDHRHELKDILDGST